MEYASRTQSRLFLLSYQKDHFNDKYSATTEVTFWEMRAQKRL